MKKLYKSPLIILVLLALSGIIAYSFLNTPPHQFKNEQCGFCHLNYEPPLLFRDNVSTLCNFCHGKRNVLSHTIGLKPSMKVPSDFHLDENGEMTCATCHDIHMDSLDKATGERNYLLRSSLRGRSLCNACHPDTSQTAGSSTPIVHSNVLESAHFGFHTSETDSIDGVSMTCLGCHEGALASSTHVALTTGNPIEGSHPIGIDYMTAHRKNAELRSPRSISSEIKFFEGKVGCTSCHNPFSLNKHQLSVTTEESRLCFECHLK